MIVRKPHKHVFYSEQDEGRTLVQKLNCEILKMRPSNCVINIHYMFYYI